MARISKRIIPFVFLALGLSTCGGQTFPEAICERVNVSYDGKPVIGVEDMAYDAQTQTLYLSAYDRRTYSTGGIYRLPIDKTAAATDLSVTTVIDNIRPHGIDLTRKNQGVTLDFIDRQGDEANKKPVIRTLSWQDETQDAISEAPPINDPALCASNDLLRENVWDTDDQIIFVTQDHKSCTRKSQSRENITSPNQANVVYIDDKIPVPITLLSGLTFANGIAASNDGVNLLYVSETRGKRVTAWVSDFTETIPLEMFLLKPMPIKLPGAPDNLTRNGNDIYAALIPSLIRFSRFSSGKAKSVSSRFAIITPAFRPTKNSFEFPSYFTTTTYDVPASVISGATVAIKAGENIWLGAAYDTAIARCTLPDSPQ